MSERSEEWEDDEDFAECTCDIDGKDSCPVHYPIDDGKDDDECLECGVCESCIERTKAFYEYMEAEHAMTANKLSPSAASEEKGSPSNKGISEGNREP